MLRFSTNFNVPYYRLYAIENDKSHFLLDRGEQELRQLATFISFHPAGRSSLSRLAYSLLSDTSRLTPFGVSTVHW
jgi:hypothetical protein